MRFISIRQLASQASETLGRFPLVLCSAGVAAVAGLIAVDKTGTDTQLLRVLISALLGIPLFTAAITTGERANWTRVTRIIVQAAGVLVLLAFWLATSRWTDTLRATRFAHLTVGFHLLVAALPFAGTSLQRGFWQYNRLLFLRYLTATLFAGVLFAGLSIALLAIDKLFGVKVDEHWYARLWIVLALIFHPWFFLGGIPRDLTSLEARDDYPAGLKVFAQFILIPVVTVYVAILTAYLVRVLATRTWPSGWIGYLVSSVSAAGTLALLLVHPIRERTDSKWVDAYGRWFYVALLPSIGMLLMATWLRVEQYGFTERRYFLAILTVWLAGIALYYGITGSRNIRVIPNTLAVVALATFLGPWSAYSVSRDSQVRRLRDLLARNEMLSDSGIRRPVRDVSFELRREMSSEVRYLIDTHGPRSLALVSDDLRRAAESKAAAPSGPSVRPIDNFAAQAVMERLGVSYVSQWESGPTEAVAFYTDIGAEPIRIEGFQWMQRANLVATFTVPLGSDTLSFAKEGAPARAVVTLRGQRLLEIPLWPLLDRAREAQQSSNAPLAPAQGSFRRPALTADAEGAGLRMRIIVTGLSGRGKGPGAEVTSVDATILVTFAR